MKNKPFRNRRLGIILLITAAVISTVLLVPGVVLGLDSTFQNGKEPAIYKVGETVTFNGSILFNGDSAEIADITSVTLSVAPDFISASPGSEAFTSPLPFNIGSFDLTTDPPASMQSRGSTLEVDVTWTDLGPGPGGYAASGYKGASVNARIGFVVRWLPPVLSEFPSPETVEPGEEVTITGTISNTGDAAGSRTVTLEINGIVEGTQDVTVAAGGSREVTFTVTRDQAGEYNVEIEGQFGTFEVTAPAAGLSIGLIIGIIVGLIAVIAPVLYFFVLRKPSSSPSGAPPSE